MTPIHSHSLQAYNTSREGRVYRVAVRSCVNFVTRRKRSYRSFFLSLWLSFWNRNVLWSDEWQNCRLYLTAFNLHIINRSYEIELHQLSILAFLKFSPRVSSAFIYFNFAFMEDFILKYRLSLFYLFSPNKLSSRCLLFYIWYDILLCTKYASYMFSCFKNGILQKFLNQCRSLKWSWSI
jgi:hypothetical protein